MLTATSLTFNVQTATNGTTIAPAETTRYYAMFAASWKTNAPATPFLAYIHLAIGLKRFRPPAYQQAHKSAPVVFATKKKPSRYQR